MKREQNGQVAEYLTKKEAGYLRLLRKEQKKEQRIFIVFALVLFFLAAVLFG